MTDINKLATKGVQINTRRTKIIHWLTDKHWWFIGLAIMGILALQFYEYNVAYSIHINAVEFLLYLACLFPIGWIIDLLIKSMSQQNQALKILDYRHRVNLAVMVHEDWNSLTTHLVKLPAEVAAIDETVLYIYKPALNRFKNEAHWIDPAKTVPVFLTQEFYEGCEGLEANGKSQTNGLPQSSISADNTPELGEYCFPILYAGYPLALLRLTLKPGEKLDEDQNSIFLNICEVMAVALKAVKFRQTLLEMRYAESSLDERRKLSQYLHDTLGPNLGYIRAETGPTHGRERFA